VIGKHIPDTDLAARVELALAAHIAAYGTTIALLQPDHNAAALAVGSGWAARTGPVLPINRALGLGMRGPVEAQQLDQIEDFYGEAGLPPEIELCPLAHPSLHALLGERNYQYRRCINVLARYGSHSSPSTTDEIAISVVPPEQPGVWAHTVAGGFGAVVPSPDSSPDIMLPRSALMRPNVTGFLATIDDEPAGAGAMAIGGGVAILFSDSTLPTFRRRGVQSALIAARLAAAQTAGCDLIVVQAAPGSLTQRNLHRHGFNVAYTNVILERP
jgi:GNAT superfamily N-acetyltransferase